MSLHIKTHRQELARLAQELAAFADYYRRLQETEHTSFWVSYRVRAEAINNALANYPKWEPETFTLQISNCDQLVAVTESLSQPMATVSSEGREFWQTQTAHLKGLADTFISDLKRLIKKRQSEITQKLCTTPVN